MKEAKNEVVNPDYYKKFPIEVIDMMCKIWGQRATMLYCEMTAFKYQMRLGHKDSVENDLGKEKWYLEKANILREQLDIVKREPSS